MASKKISQREAHRNRRELQRLHDEHAALFARFSGNYPGVDLGAEQLSVQLWSAVNTASKLGYAVIVKPADNWKLNYRAVKS